MLFFTYTSSKEAFKLTKNASMLNRYSGQLSENVLEMLK